MERHTIPESDLDSFVADAKYVYEYQEYIGEPQQLL